ncbi:MAG: caspase family protein [Hyphomicrobiaceae bacterium]
MKRLLLVLLALILGTAAGTDIARAEKRVALLIGNASYKRFGALTNPVQDVKAVADTLRAADFEIVEAIDQSHPDLERTVRGFLGRLDGADVSLVYYSGHAVQVGGRNYIIPIDAKLDSELDLDFEAIDLDTIMRFMAARSKVRLVFLDACRNNPFAGRPFSTAGEQTRSVASRGLARIDAGVGTLIAFSTEPGNVALDGEKGGTSPFTSAFVKHALTPAIDVRQMLTAVRNEVIATTQGKQVPWENSSLVEDFFFVPKRPPPIVADMHQVAMAPGGRVALGIPEPQQPEGGDLKVTIEAVPDDGRILLAGQQIENGSTLTSAELASLELDGSNLAQGSVAMLRYRVDDAWGNAKTAIVVVTATQAADTAPASVAGSVATAPQDLLRVLQESIEADRSVDAGVGPVLLVADLAVLPPGAKDYRLRIDGFPERGELTSGNRHLGRGETIEVAELGSLGYSAHASGVAKGDSAKVYLTMIDTAGRSVATLAAPLGVGLNPCDKLAGEPLDLEGVADGVAPNELDVAAARPACIKAVFDHPTVTRFFYELGRVELAARNTERGVELVRKASDAGYIRAHTTYAMLLARGALGTPDPQAANVLLEQGAAAGDPFALNELGQRLYFGRDIEQDRKRGLTMLLQSAEMGHTYAINALGAIFETGIGVAADPKRALGFYVKSVARNDIYGFNNLGIYLLEGRDGGQPDYPRALELFLKAHKGGHPFAATNIGRMYYLGLGVKKDTPQAMLWYGLSADRGDPYAANNLGYILLHGEAGEADPAAAAGYYAHAIALDQEAPRADAELALLAIPEAAQRQATSRLLVELGYADADAAKAGLKGKVGDKVQADLGAAGLERPKGTTATLVALAKLKWLRSKPRFDLF